MNTSISQYEIKHIAQAITGLSMDVKTVKNSFYVAMGRAIKRTRNKLAQIVAKELDLPIKMIRNRLYIYKREEKGVYKLWVGLNSIALDGIGRPRQQGLNVLVKGLTVQNAYISKAGRVRLRKSNTLARLDIDTEAEHIIQQQLPYIFRHEFEHNFSQLLRYKFKG